MGEGMDAAGGTGPGWYPDPSGAYDHRWFDGVRWTDQVSKDGVAQRDLRPSPAFSPSAVAGSGITLGHLPSTSTRPPLAVTRNAVGPGLWIVLAGLVVSSASTLLPWINGKALFEIPSPSRFGSNDLPMQALFALVSLGFTMLMACARYQPGKLAGFLYGGCIGLIVCWNKLDDDEPSRRSNYLAIFVLFAQIASVLVITYATDRLYGPEYERGIGPVVYAFGFVLGMAGAFVGRRREQTSLG